MIVDSLKIYINEQIAVLKIIHDCSGDLHPITAIRILDNILSFIEKNNGKCVHDYYETSALVNYCPDCNDTKFICL